MKIKIRKKEGWLKGSCYWFVECRPGDQPQAYGNEPEKGYGWRTFDAAIYFATTGLHPDERDVDPV